MPSQTSSADPFTTHERHSSTPNEGHSNDSLDPVNLSIGGSEVGLSALEFDDEGEVRVFFLIADYFNELF